MIMELILFNAGHVLPFHLRRIPEVIKKIMGRCACPKFPQGVDLPIFGPEGAVLENFWQIFEKSWPKNAIELNSAKIFENPKLWAKIEFCCIFRPFFRKFSKNFQKRRLRLRIFGASPKKSCPPILKYWCGRFASQGQYWGQCPLPLPPLFSPPDWSP